MAKPPKSSTPNPHAAEAARQLRKFANACRLDGDAEDCFRIDAAAYLLDPNADVEESDGVESLAEIADEEPPPTKPKRVAKAVEAVPRAPAREQVIEYEEDLDDLAVEPAPAPKRGKKPARE